MLTQQQCIELYQEACHCDVKAFKPGNVSIYSDGHDMVVEDFLVSAEQSAEPITRPDYSLGQKIYFAIEATRNAVGCNTNLGIVLLCAPIIQAVQLYPSQSLAVGIQQVLKNTTVEDASWVFKAIVLASPGGLGQSSAQDVNDQAEVSLIDAMEIAKNRDRIALQYVTNYKDIFNFSILRYNLGLTQYGSREWAASLVFSGLLSQFPDSHIERKYGNKYSNWVLEKIITVDQALLRTNMPEQILPLLHEVDGLFKAKSINPGTTADLTVATVLVGLLEAFSVR